MLNLIIWGSRGVTKAVGSGQFGCPRCRQMTPFNHVKVQRYFTLYFIPLFPIGTSAEYVECGYCQGKFAPNVLQLSMPQPQGWGPQQGAPQQGWGPPQGGPPQGAPQPGWGPQQGGPPQGGPPQGWGPPGGQQGGGWGGGPPR